MAIISWYKKYTETLERTLERFVRTHPKYKDSKITYAGRLDPMAEGLLLLLTGSDVHKKEKFLGFEKVYEVDFILGVETDTYDILGMLTSQGKDDVSDKHLIQEINNLLQITTQVYPPYSSKPVLGKPLWKWAKEGRLDEIRIPEKSVEILEPTYLGQDLISKDILECDILEALELVDGDFRQDEIISSWKSHFENTDREQFKVHRMRVRVSSGTYIRSLVSHIGTELGVGATSLKIRRIQVGKYT